MMNHTTVEALAVLRLQEYAKLLKNTSFAVFFVCNTDSITIWSTGDCLYSTINRIIVPNNIGVTGTMALQMTQFNEFCKNLLMPSTPILISNKSMQIVDNPDCKLLFWPDLERDFFIRLNRLINLINYSATHTLDIGEDNCNHIKDKLLSMKSSMPSEMIYINDKYLITIFAGMLPINKADTLSIKIMEFMDTHYYLVEYIIHKKKYQYPVSVFYKYKRP